MKTIIALVSVLACCLSMLTSTHFKLDGVDVRNKTYDYVKVAAEVSTSCKVVNLNVAPYNYDGNSVRN